MNSNNIREPKKSQEEPSFNHQRYLAFRKSVRRIHLQLCSLKALCSFSGTSKVSSEKSMFEHMHTFKCFNVTKKEKKQKLSRKMVRHTDSWKKRWILHQQSKFPTDQRLAMLPCQTNNFIPPCHTRRHTHLRKFATELTSGPSSCVVRFLSNFSS